MWYAGAVLILLVALIFNLGLLAYAMYALLAVMLVSRYLSGWWVQGLEAERTCDRLTAEVGEEVTVAVSVKNRGALPVPWVLLEDLLPQRALIHNPPSLQVSGQRMRLAMLAPKGHKALFYKLRCNRRGYYQLGPLVLETGDLFGLHRRYRVATHPHFLLVFPQVMPLDGFEVASRRPIGEVRMTYRLYEDPTRIAGVRLYEPGDPLNRVNWRATARTGTLHSKVYEPSTIAGATILLDFHRDSHKQQHEPLRSELAVTAAASIANAIYQMGHQVGLVTNGRDAADRIRQEGWDYDIRSRQSARRAGEMLDDSDRLRPVVVPTRRGPEQLVRILESLARVELTDGLKLPDLLLEPTARMPRDATVLAILPDVTPEVAIALSHLQWQGFAVAAVLNIFDEYDFSQASGPLLAAGIPTFHLRDQQHVATVCRNYVLGRA
jgi:uncharacterized repeat protein (TIGR01451 family)